MVDKDHPGVKVMHSYIIKGFPADYPGNNGELNTWQIALTSERYMQKQPRRLGGKILMERP